MLKKNKPLKYHQSYDPRGGQVSERPRAKEKASEQNSNEEWFIYENEMTDWINGELTKETATDQLLCATWEHASSHGICSWLYQLWMVLERLNFVGHVANLRSSSN